MKVLLSSFQCMPNQGSELGNGWNWARALTDCGHDVTVLTQESHIIRAAAPPDIKFLHVDPVETPLLRFRPLVGTAPYWYLYYVGWQDAALRYVEAQADRYDVVHHVSWGSLHLGCPLWRLPAPLLYGPIGGGQTPPGRYLRYFGNSWPAEMLRTSATGPMLRSIKRSRETLRHSAVILAENSATAAACERVGAGDIRYFLGSGLPSEWLVAPRSRPVGTPVVLWVGRLLPRKAPVLALEAFAELRREMPARLVVAGDGPLFEQLQSTVASLGLTNDVQLLGRVPWENLKTLYDSASAFLFTSLRDSFGAQFLEALGRGLPAVALDHHGIGDADVGRAALKVPIADRPEELPARIASALRTVLTDGGWERRSEAGIEWASGHVWPAKAAAVTKIYEEVAARWVDEEHGSGRSKAMPPPDRSERR